MAELIDSLRTTWERLDARSFIDILAIAVVFYWLLRRLRGTTAMALLRGFLLVLIVGFALTQLLELTVLAWLFRNSLPALLIAVPILFQPELRRTLERIGQVGLRGWASPSSVEQTIDTVVRASLFFSQRRHGALMVLERSMGLQEYTATGVQLDATPSLELLTGLFLHDSLLHDGAAILRQGRIAAGGCFLPLPQDSQPPSPWGTRHRAAMEITERTDAIAVVVSEETGKISMASDGRLLTGLDEVALRQGLTSLLSPTLTPIGRLWARWKEREN